MVDAVIKSATFSPCRLYRYTLTRIWGPSTNFLACIGLNPSTADETTDDATIRKVIAFAKLWGYDGLVMLNLFGYRATDPKDMKLQAAPVGDGNDAAIELETTNREVLCAWGNDGSFLGRDLNVWRSILRRRHCVSLGTNKDGSPRHPLYLPYTTQRITWAKE